MRRLCLVTAVAASFGCAPALQSTPPSPAATSASGLSGPSNAALQAQIADVQATMLAMKVAEERAERTCSPLRLAEISPATELVVGRQLALGTARRQGALRTDADAVRVAAVGQRLARYSARPDLAWTFALVDNPAPSSSAQPGGYVFVSTGLLAATKDDAQLAGVLAHEIAHVTQKHALLRYRDARVKMCLAAITAKAMLEGSGSSTALMMSGAQEMAKLAVAFESPTFETPGSPLLAMILDTVLQVLEAGGYTNEDELHSDATTLELMTGAGYDRGAYEQLLESLDEHAYPRHPPRAERIAKLKALRESAP